MVNQMAKSYVKFEVAQEVVDKTYEALKQVKQSGTIKKGANEVTKSVERGLSSFVVIATDVEPEEVVMHIPTLCEQKKIPYTYVPSKLELGKSIGLTVQCAAIAVENKGAATGAIADIVSKLTGVAPKSAASPEKKEQPKAAAAPQPKKEKPAQPAAAPAPTAAPKQ
jgi:large subunit ribosomal protein L7Ae